MPAGVELLTLVPAVIIILAGSLIKSTTGFGLAMVSAPLLLLLWEPVLVVPVLLPLMFTVDALIVAQKWRLLEIRRVAPMTVAGVLGIPLGTYVLLAAPEDALRLAIPGLTIVSAALLLLGIKVPLSRERLAAGIAGLLSGLLISSTAMSGPPVALFLINQRWAKDTFRASLGFFFLTLDILAIIALTVTGVLDGGTLLVSAALWPAVLVGYLAAVRLLPHIRQQVFLRMATIAVLAAAVLAMASALR